MSYSPPKVTIDLAEYEALKRNQYREDSRFIADISGNDIILTNPIIKKSIKLGTIETIYIEDFKKGTLKIVVHDNRSYI